jgi:hypothetical protein
VEKTLWRQGRDEGEELGGVNIERPTLNIEVEENEGAASSIAW